MLLARNFDKPAIAGTGTTTCADIAIVASNAIRPHDYLATIAGCSRIGIYARISADISIFGIFDVRITALVITANQHRTATGSTRSIDTGIAEQADIVSQNMDGAAGRRCILTGHINTAAMNRITTRTNQANHAALIFNSTRADQTRVVHDVGEYAAGCRGRQ